MTQTDRWYVLSNFGGLTLCSDERDACKSAAQYDAEYPNHAPHVATRMVPVCDDDHCSTVELRAEVLRLRIALSQCKYLAERMRIWNGVEWYWGNPGAPAIVEAVDSALAYDCE